MRTQTAPQVHSGPEVGATIRLSPRAEVELDPHRAWLNTLAGGAAIGAAGMIAAAAWGCALLTLRMHSTRPTPALMAADGGVLLGTAASSWIATWALTTQEPSHLKPKIGPLVKSFRWIASITFFATSCWALHLFNELPPEWQPEGVRAFLRISVDAMSTLLMIQTIALSLQLGYRSLIWRAIVAMVGLLGTTAICCAPFFIESLAHHDRAGRQFRNVQDAMSVLWETVAALVFVRLLVSVLGEKLKRSNG